MGHGHIKIYCIALLHTSRNGLLLELPLKQKEERAVVKLQRGDGRDVTKMDAQLPLVLGCTLPIKLQKNESIDLNRKKGERKETFRV